MDEHVLVDCRAGVHTSGLFYLFATILNLYSATFPAAILKSNDNWLEVYLDWPNISVQPCII